MSQIFRVCALRVCALRVCAFTLTLSPILAPARVAFCQPLPDRAPLAGAIFDRKGEPIADAVLSIRAHQQQRHRRVLGRDDFVR